jgi:hypothetical protein
MWEFCDIISSGIYIKEFAITCVSFFLCKKLFIFFQIRISHKDFVYKGVYKLKQPNLGFVVIYLLSSQKPILFQFRFKKKPKTLSQEKALKKTE